MSDLRPRTRGRRLDGVARHGRLSRGAGWLLALKVVATIAVVGLISTISVAAIAVTQLTSSVDQFDITGGKGNNQVAPSVGAFQGGFNIMLSGSDTRVGQDDLGGSVDGHPPLNDVNILLHVSADHERAVAISIPRDLITAIPQCTDQKTGTTYPAVSAALFNTSLSRGGMNCVVQTMNKLSGLQIDYAALITFQGVVAMTDAVGGVNVCVAGPVTDRQSGLTITKSEIQPDGTVNLVGDQALAFLRNRHGVQGGSDLSRINSQQVYLSALVRQLTSAGTLGDLGKVYGIAKAVTQNMSLSSNMSQADTIVSMALALKDIRPSNVTFVQLPVQDDPADANRVIPITEQMTKLFELVSADQAFDLGADALGGQGSYLAPGQQTASAPATPNPTAGTDTGTGTGATPAPGGTSVATPTPAPTLDVRGQTANQVTCSNTVGAKR